MRKIDGLRVRRLDDILPQLQKHRVEKSPLERIEALELAVEMLKSRIFTMENKENEG
jgi:hypothetical protein